MLSRVAEDVYWMARYAERAQNFSRILAVRLAQSAQMLAKESNWPGLLTTFGETHGTAGTDVRDLIIHAIFEEECPISLRFTVERARENARMARDLVSPEMWHVLTRMHTLLATPEFVQDDDAWDDLLNDLTMDSLTFQGLLQSTVLHDEAYHFIHAGTAIERAQSTLLLLTSYLDSLDTWEQEPLFAVNMLKSLTGYGAFRRSYRMRLNAADVLEFLLFEQAFPRSLAGASRELQEATDNLPQPRGPVKARVGLLTAQICYDSIEAVMEAGPLVYFTELVEQFKKIHEDLAARYFQPEVQEV